MRNRYVRPLCFRGYPTSIIIITVIINIVATFDDSVPKCVLRVSISVNTTDIIEQLCKDFLSNRSPAGVSYVSYIKGETTFKYHSLS